jgi:hypothetical protein
LKVEFTDDAREQLRVRGVYDAPTTHSVWIDCSSSSIPLTTSRSLPCAVVRPTVVTVAPGDVR